LDREGQETADLIAGQPDQDAGDNDDAIDAWLPDGVGTDRYVDLLFVDGPVRNRMRERYRQPGEVRRNEWLIRFPDGMLQVVSDSSYRSTWRRIPRP